MPDTDAEMEDDADAGQQKLLAEAFCAYVHTYPSKERLAAFVKERGLEVQHEEMEKELNAVIGTADHFLFNYPDGVPWDGPFLVAFRKTIREKHPWMVTMPEAMGALSTYAQYICWHDGLNR